MVEEKIREKYTLHESDSLSSVVRDCVKCRLIRKSEKAKERLFEIEPRWLS